MTYAYKQLCSKRVYITIHFVFDKGIFMVRMDHDGA